jgi:hypothetical protein
LPSETVAGPRIALTSGQRDRRRSSQHTGPASGGMGTAAPARSSPRRLPRIAVHMPAPRPAQVGSHASPRRRSPRRHVMSSPATRALLTTVPPPSSSLILSTSHVASDLLAGHSQSALTHVQTLRRAPARPIVHAFVPRGKPIHTVHWWSPAYSSSSVNHKDPVHGKAPAPRRPAATS